jgi:hypothetical protein
MRSAVLVVAPRAREAEPVHVKQERGLNIGYVQDGACEPIGNRHRLDILKLKITSYSISFKKNKAEHSVGIAEAMP